MYQKHTFVYTPWLTNSKPSVSLSRLRMYSAMATACSIFRPKPAVPTRCQDSQILNESARRPHWSVMSPRS